MQTVKVKQTESIWSHCSHCMHEESTTRNRFWKGSGFKHTNCISKTRQDILTSSLRNCSCLTFSWAKFLSTFYMAVVKHVLYHFLDIHMSEWNHSLGTVTVLSDVVEMAFFAVAQHRQHQPCRRFALVLEDRRANVRVVSSDESGARDSGGPICRPL